MNRDALKLHAIRNVDTKDIDQLLVRVKDDYSAHGKFWREVLSELRDALEAEVS